jgi:hypothetical protein
MIGNVVALGLSAAINPILLGVVLVTLASPRPKALLGAYVAGAMTFSVGLGIGAVSLASGTGAVTPTTSATNGLVPRAHPIRMMRPAARAGWIDASSQSRGPYAAWSPALPARRH